MEMDKENGDDDELAGIATGTDCYRHIPGDKVDFLKDLTAVSMCLSIPGHQYVSQDRCFVLVIACWAAAPFISLTVAGKEFAALLDSGSSASLIGDEVLRHLQQKSVRLRHRETTFQLACGSTTSRGAVRIVVRWNQRAQRQRFVHLAGLTVPIILGRDFLAHTGIIIDVASGGYREGAHAPLSNFRERSMGAMAAALGKATEQESADRDDAMPMSHPTPGSAEHCDEMGHPLANADGLSRPERERLAALLHNSDEMFTEQPGCTKQVPHRIETGDARPWKSNPRPVSLAKRKAIDAAVDELLKSGIIRRSSGPWGFPGVLVPKKNGTSRLCVDYRRLNAVTVRDAYPFPSIEEVISNLGKAKYFTTLDASKGYLEVEMSPGDESKTAFVCHRGLFEFTRMPFGLTGAPMTFQRLIDGVLGDAKWQHALAYLDDIIVYSETFEDHLLPTDVGGVRRFLGMIGYYRAYIPNCAATQAPLTQLLRKAASWSWEAPQEEAFLQLTEALARTASLKLPDLNRPFTIQTDASDQGLGAVHLQETEGEIRPVAFASRALNPAEKNYTVSERECLAIIFALKKFNHYVEGTEFTIETDHMALAWLSRIKEPAGRLARWALTLQKYEYRIRYRKGTTNVVADALSRAPVDPPPREAADYGGGAIPRETGNPASRSAPHCGGVAQLAEAITSLGPAFNRTELYEAQQSDSFCRAIFDRLRQEMDPDQTGEKTLRHSGTPRGPSAIAQESDIEAGELESYLIDGDGVLLRYFPEESDSSESFKTVIPRDLRVAALRLYHDADGHGSAPKSWHKLRRFATWPGMKGQLCRYVRSCAVCQECKPRGGRPPGRLAPHFSKGPAALLPMPHGSDSGKFTLCVSC
ncbi:uncharacterized protein ISCGN_024582 [Ixodes scapularis]